MHLEELSAGEKASTPSQLALSAIKEQVLDNIVQAYNALAYSHIVLHAMGNIPKISFLMSRLEDQIKDVSTWVKDNRSKITLGNFGSPSYSNGLELDPEALSLVSTIRHKTSKLTTLIQEYILSISLEIRGTSSTKIDAKATPALPGGNLPVGQQGLGGGGFGGLANGAVIGNIGGFGVPTGQPQFGGGFGRPTGLTTTGLFGR